jgi:hypothetical protein
MSESPTFQARNNLSRNRCCGQAKPACKTTESFARHVSTSAASAALQPDRHAVEWISRRIYTGPVARPQTADAGCRSRQLPASLWTRDSEIMKQAGIISRAQSLQILKNDLHKVALEKHAGELATATAEDRQKMMAQIDRDIEKELRWHMRRVEPGNLIH